MKQEFEMSEEQLEAIYDISRNKSPIIHVGVWIGLNSQEKANKLWQIMGDEMGFIWDSVEPSSKGKRFFIATSKQKVIPLTAKEVSIKKYVDGGLLKIVEQLEFCNYESSEGGRLEMNIAFIALKRLAEGKTK